MALEALEKTIRINVPYFEGVNGAISYVLAKKTELAHAENARSKSVGSLEKREGQSITGVNSAGGTFITTANYRLAYFPNNTASSLYRVSGDYTLSINVQDRVSMIEAYTFTPALIIAQSESISIGEIVNDNNSTGNTSRATIFYLDAQNNYWMPLSGKGAGIIGAKFDHVIADGCLFLVNGYDSNRYVKADGTTVVDSADGTGHLFNSPKAKKIAYYKNRIYLGNYYRNTTWYKNNVLRSSYPSGIISLVNEDTSSTTIPVTDNKYFYATSGANRYEVYRGPTKIADLEIISIQENSITATITYTTGNTSLLASDEIWVSGTYNGEKVYRWAANPSMTGSDVKQYDTMKISGAENDEITMMTTVGDVLMITNKNSISVWNDYILQSIDMGVGCISHTGYVKNYGALYFIHYTGIYTTTGGTPTPISQKVQRYIDGATKEGLENAAAGKKGRSVFFAIGDVTLYAIDGSVDKVLQKVCLEYNINQSNWFVHTNVDAYQFETYRDDTNYDRLEMMTKDDNNSVREFLDPNTSTDVGVNIPMRIDANQLTLQSEFENVSYPVALIVEADRGSQMEAFISLDRDVFYRIDGAVRKGVNLLRINGKDSKRGKPNPAYTVSVSIRDASDQICKLSRFALVHVPSLANTDTSQ